MLVKWFVNNLNATVSFSGKLDEWLRKRKAICNQMKVLLREEDRIREEASRLAVLSLPWMGIAKVRSVSHLGIKLWPGHLSRVTVLRGRPPWILLPGTYSLHLLPSSDPGELSSVRATRKWGDPDINSLSCDKWECKGLVKNPSANTGRCKKHGFEPWVGKIP